MLYCILYKAIILFNFLSSVNPSSSPQLIINQIDCPLKLSWKTLAGAEHYLITITSGNTVTIINETTNMTRYYGPLTADMIIEIRIAAVNQCGQKGPTETYIIMEPTPCRLTQTNPIGMCYIIISR